MQIASPKALAGLIKKDKQILLGHWEAAVQQVGAAPLPSEFLRDHVPDLLDELAAELEHPETARQRVERFSAAHGEQRQRAGMELPQVVEEYKLLRRVLVRHAEASGLAVTGDAGDIVNSLIDEGIKRSIETYIRCRDDIERMRRDEYLKFVVHDLRSPLAAIYYAILLVERELARVEVSELVRSAHDAVKRNIERMRALIVKLLQEEDNVRTPEQVAVQREPANLWAVAESAVRTLASLAASSETTVLNDIPRDITLNADAELLERVFQNLLSNAIEHTRKGRVTVRADVHADGAIECWVSDNGRGIAPQVRDKVFDKFVTANQRRTGVGLGLAIVKQLVEAHGGSIDLQSEVGQGTTAHFFLPKAGLKSRSAAP